MAGQFFTQSIDKSIKMLEKTFKNFEEADTSDENRFVSILISKPGVGKSATIAQMADRLGYTLIDLNLACIEPTDIIGLGAREKVDGQWQTMPALPQWVETALNGKCIVFVDEFNNTTQDVLSGFQKMFSDFVIDGKKLPRTTHIIGACNAPGPDAIYAQKKLSGAFRRRLCMIPVVDDFEYVMKKHNFVLPQDFMKVDYDDLMKYCEYDGVSSAVIDNVFNISTYSNLSEVEKVTLVSGFGSGALNVAKNLKIFSDETFALGDTFHGETDMEYSEWKKDPRDVISEHQQIYWGAKSLRNSVSYSRSKSFVEKIENATVYRAMYEILMDEFEDEFEMDEYKLPEDNAEIVRGLKK